MVERLTVSDETYRRLIKFKQVVEAILDESIELDDYAELVLDRGLNGMLEDLMEPQDKETLVKSWQQLAERYPEQVFEFMVDVLKRGEAIREAARGKLGFPIPEKENREHG